MRELVYILKELTALPMFGIALTITTYAFGVWLNRKARTPLVNPLLISVILIVCVLLVFRIPYENYQSGGQMIELFLGPATAALAVKIYEQFELFKKNWLPIFAGAAVGAGASILCVTLMCRMFSLDEVLVASMMPKSVTTAIAVPLSVQNGGDASITVAAVIFTGILGAVFAPALIRLFRISDPVEAGIAIGTNSHALGTAKAIEIGDVEGAMSGIAIGIAGAITVVYMIFIKL